MDDKPYLRRQAALCLKLSQSCPDADVAEHLDLMAAEFHMRALQAEFQAGSDLPADSFDERDIENLRLLLGRTEVAAMFDETARERIGEFISRAAQGQLGALRAEKKPEWSSFRCDGTVNRLEPLRLGLSHPGGRNGSPGGCCHVGDRIGSRRR